MDRNLRKELASAIEFEMASVPAFVTWGLNDCVVFVANPLRQVLGKDPIAPWRHTYCDRETAQEVIGDMGLAFAMRNVARSMGWRRIPANEAQSGDVGLVKIGTSLTTAICRLPGWFVMRSEEGVAAVPSRRIRFVWSVL